MHPWWAEVFFFFYLLEALFAVKVYIPTFYLQLFPGGEDTCVANLSLLKISLFFLFTFLWLRRNSPPTCQAPWTTGYKPQSFRKRTVSEDMKITLVTLLVACGLRSSEAPPEKVITNCGGWRNKKKNSALPTLTEVWKTLTWQCLWWVLLKQLLLT